MSLLAASWRGQLEMLAGAGILLGFTLVGITDPSGRTLQLLVAQVELWFLVAWSVRAAASANETFSGMSLVDDLRDTGRALPWILSGVLVTGAPAFVTALAFWAASSVHPLLGLLLVLPVFLVTLLVLAPMLLAVCSAALGERSWMPRAAIAAARRGSWRVTGAMLVVSVVAGIAALPLAVVGMVIAANTGGVVAMVFGGVAASGALPVLGCAAFATWRELDVELELPDGVAAAEAPRIAPGTPVVQGANGTVEALEWVDGPVWDAALEPGGAWGTWMRLPATANVGLRITWSGELAPVLAFGRADGTWQSPPQPTVSGEVTYARVDAGDTYLQLVSRAPGSQSVSVALVATGAAAAA